MKIGFLLLTSPSHEDPGTVYRLCKIFLKQGHTVEIFLMEDGVLNGIKTQSPLKLNSPWGEIIGEEAKISLCTQTFEQRGLKKDQLLPKVHLSNQQGLAKIVASADRFLVFG